MGGWGGVGEAQSVSDQLVEISIAGVCSYRDQNFSTANDDYPPYAWTGKALIVRDLSLAIRFLSLELQIASFSSPGNVTQGT